MADDVEMKNIDEKNPDKNPDNKSDKNPDNKSGLSLLSVTDVYNFLRSLADGKTPVVCTINNEATSVIRWKNKKLKLIKKSSSSPSEVIFTDLVLGGIDKGYEFPVSIKVFPNFKADKDLTGLVYEAYVYNYIITHIIKHNYSPNFVGYVGYGCCPSFIQNNDIEQYVYPKSTSSNLLKRADEDQKNIDTFFNTEKLIGTMADTGACLLLTERVGNGAYFNQPGMHPVSSLQAVISSVNETDRKSILFQIMYGLEVMARLKIMHNDLHPLNVLVTILPSPVSLGFNVGKKYFLITTKYIPYFFDWDLSFVEALGTNPKISDQFWAEKNILNKFTPRYDLYTLMCMLKRYIQDNLFPDFFVGNYFEWQEGERYVTITKQEYDNIITFEPFTTFTEPSEDGKHIYTYNVYKFSGTQIRSIVGGFEGVKNIMFRAYGPTPSGKYIIQAFKGYPCRASTISKDMPTPLQALNNDYFSEFSKAENVVEEAVTDNKFLYMLPKKPKNKKKKKN